MEVSAFITEQLKEQRDHDEKLRQEAKGERQEFEAKFIQQQAEAKADMEQALKIQMREQRINACTNPSC